MITLVREHSTAQHSTAQRSAAQHSTAQHRDRDRDRDRARVVGHEAYGVLSSHEGVFSAFLPREFLGANNPIVTHASSLP